MNIGSRLKQILDERQMNVSQLSREAGIPAQTLYAMIKRDSNKADMDIMARLLEALDLDLLEFLQMEPRRKKRVRTGGRPEEKAEPQRSAGELEKSEESAGEQVESGKAKEAAGAAEKAEAQRSAGELEKPEESAGEQVEPENFSRRRGDIEDYLL